MRVLTGTMAICRLGPGAAVPAWADQAGFAYLMRTNESLTIVCRRTLIPEGIAIDEGWRCIEVLGPLDLSLTGILASLTSPLSRAGIPVFAMSSYETDFILVKEAHLAAAVESLSAAGYHIDTTP